MFFKRTFLYSDENEIFFVNVCRKKQQTSGYVITITKEFIHRKQSLYVFTIEFQE